MEPLTPRQEAYLTKYKEIVATARYEMEKQHQWVNYSATNAASLRAQLRTLLKDHEDLCESVKTMSRQVAMKSGEVDELKHSVWEKEALVSQNNETIRKMRESHLHQDEHDKKLKALQEEHDARVNQHLEEHDEKVKALHAEYGSHLSDYHSLKSSHQSKLEEHNSVVDWLRMEHSEALAKAINDHKVFVSKMADEHNKRVSEMHEHRTSLKDDHEKVVASMEADFQQEFEDLTWKYESQYESLKHDFEDEYELLQSHNNRELANAHKAVEEANAKVAELQKAHTDALGKLKSDYEDYHVKALQAVRSDMKDEHDMFHLELENDLDALHWNMNDLEYDLSKKLGGLFKDRLM